MKKIKCRLCGKKFEVKDDWLEDASYLTYLEFSVQDENKEEIVCHDCINKIRY